MHTTQTTIDAIKAVDYIQLKVTSSAFENEKMIPVRYTCDGQNVNPPLNIEHIPELSKSLVLIVEDPDAPVRAWVHWIVWNIPVTHHLKENNVHGIEGFNDFLQNHYGGPCPPHGTHRYFFKVYALDSLLNLKTGAKRNELEKIMSEHIIGFGELIGLYKRK
ncbi:MAG: YbhB/YbcL family Raf kinase inhibitor-like protein [Ferruginibacter sp.]